MSTPWYGLEAELRMLEQNDPAVKAARQRLNDLPDQFARAERHQAARKAVGVRAIPDAVRDAIANTIHDVVAPIDGYEEETARAVVTALRTAGYKITPIREEPPQ
jgi:hypothetical protein